MKYSALIGHPVDHSISPALFDLLAEQAGIEYGHIKVGLSTEEIIPQHLESFKSLGFSGINVTLPYKLKVIKYLDKIDQSAEKVGAVNSIIFNNNKAVGYNTDGAGAMRAIEDQLRPITKADKVLIIGAGGAARAIIYELYKKTKKIKIINRYPKEANQVAKDLADKRDPIKIYKLNDKNLAELIQEANLIVNATPIGMYPNSQEEIVKDKIFNKIEDIDQKLFFDAIFNPFHTKFLKSAQKRKAKICSGMYMMIYQALEALKLWIGKEIKNIDSREIAELMKKEL